MSEKLIIKNFGPIEKAELELRKFNILIGEQATGKSTVAKLLAICRYFSYIVEEDIRFYDQPFLRGLISWGLEESIQKKTEIYYECKHYALSVKQISEEVLYGEKGSIKSYQAARFSTRLIPLTKEFSNLLNELNNLKPATLDSDSMNWVIPSSFFQNDVAAVLDNPFYIPAERGLQSIFSLGKSSILNLNDSFFYQLSEIARITQVFKAETEIEPLDIVYKNVEGDGLFRKKDNNRFYYLGKGATGYKSAIPIVLITKYYCDIRKRKKTFIIEEPEQSLFPNAQQKLVEYLADKIDNYSNTVLIETHSPYILTSLNNLIYAYQIGKTEPFKTKEIIEEKYWLNPDDVSAYMMLSNGFCEDIMDRQENMIKAEKIDGASRYINEQFDSLLNLEFKDK